MSQFVMSPPAARYTRTAMVLHWAIAILILANIALGLTADDFPDALVRPVIDLHKSIGLTVLGLVVLRILWRLTHKPPALPASYHRAERLAAQAAHGLLYGLILLMPISGWLHDSAFKDAAAHPLRLFWVIPWFRISAIADIAPDAKEQLHSLFYLLHAWSAYLLEALVGAHVLGALKHQFIDGEAELQRMGLRPGRSPRG
jgi:cytochrome b561